MSPPMRYFEYYNAEIVLLDVLGWNKWEQPDEQERAKWHETFRDSDLIIIGGGGLLEIDFFERSLQYIFSLRQSHQKIILWGAGHNQWDVNDWRAIKKRIDWKKYPFDEIGVRDAGEVMPWVPCASCMADELDDHGSVEHEFALYLTADGISANPVWTEAIRNEFPMMSNSSEFHIVISFLRSGETILTDSYHGAYWATLLGKKVVAFPSSSKYYSLKHPVPLCDPEDWRRFSKLARIYDGALEECRSANLLYYRQIESLLLD
ncbi:hypothetical protein [Azospirillum largimobile]